MLSAPAVRGRDFRAEHAGRMCGPGLPGSMCGALLCGLVFWKTKNLAATLVGEVFGTGIIGGLAAYPVAVLFMNVSAAAVAFYAYIIPFLISTVAGSILAGILVAALKRTGALKTMGAALEQ